MQIQTPIESVHATAFTGSLSGMFGWETSASAVFLGTHTQIEISPDERPELELLAGRMAVAMSAKERN